MENQDSLEGTHRIKSKIMIIKIISAALILTTAFLSFKHGWAGISNNLNPTEIKMMSDLGIGKSLLMAISIVSLAVGILVLIPQTFFIGNFLNAVSILLIMSLALKTNNYKMILIEIPFLLMPLILIWLGHPLKK